MRRLRSLCRSVRIACAFASVVPVIVLAQAPSPSDANQVLTTAQKPFNLQPPPPKSPVDSFRSLLVMSPIERREFISKRPPEAQKIILAKIKEYEGLKPEQRELRLRVTELRWYLMPLLTSSVTNRPARLATMPDILRPLVEDRLREWDKLPARVQRDLLDNESTVRFYFELAARTPDQQAQSVTNMSPAMHQQIEDGIQRWQRLSDQQRGEIVQHFSQYFDLTPPEQARTLSTLSEPERAEIDKTLQSFRKLSPAQRGQCLRSFQKLVSLSPAERQEFLKNAERWEQMTPTERESWRNLVSTLSHEPPLPPGPRIPQIPSPPNISRPGTRPASLMTETN
jgi:hypothetical protein